MQAAWSFAGRILYAFGSANPGDIRARHCGPLVDATFHVSVNDLEAFGTTITRFVEAVPELTLSSRLCFERTRDADKLALAAFSR
jgi:hypothetical protein